MRKIAALLSAALAVVMLAGCSDREDAPITSTPQPSPMKSVEGMWALQTLGDTVLLTLVEEPLINGQVPSYGEIVLTSDGCFGLEGDLGAMVLVPSNDAVLLSSGEFESGGVRFKVGDQIIVSGGGGFSGSDLPDVCASPGGAVHAATIEIDSESKPDK